MLLVKMKRKHIRLIWLFKCVQWWHAGSLNWHFGLSTQPDEPWNNWNPAQDVKLNSHAFIYWNIAAFDHSTLNPCRLFSRDLKCENLLLDSENTLKVSDFGFARFYDNGVTSKTFCGSAAYAAPEVLQGIPYHVPLHDIWAMGIILYIMVGEGTFTRRKLRCLSLEDFE